MKNIPTQSSVELEKVLKLVADKDCSVSEIEQMGINIDYLLRRFPYKITKYQDQVGQSFVRSADWNAIDQLAKRIVMNLFDK
ncbi:MAG: hypothetical protein OXI87_19820 [Albidovulum sp.]|nr:hypothetical protein [Albidovulum sp.]